MWLGHSVGWVTFAMRSCFSVRYRSVLGFCSCRKHGPHASMSQHHCAYSTCFSWFLEDLSKGNAAGYSCFMWTLCTRQLNPSGSATVPLRVIGTRPSTTKKNPLCVLSIAKTTRLILTPMCVVVLGLKTHCACDIRRLQGLIRKFCYVVPGNDAAVFHSNLQAIG